MTDIRVALLGVDGGPVHWAGGQSGISTAVIVGDSWYLVDCGAGFARQAALAGLDFSRLRASFITHLHSDHIVDLPHLLLFGWWDLSRSSHLPLPVLGPEMDRVWNDLSTAFAEDIEDRVSTSLLPPPSTVFAPQRLDLAGSDSSPSAAGEAMEPVEIYRDQNVVVTATLVSHPPMSPSYAFRFDAGSSSVTISGDTAPSRNLIRLARGTTVLLHEVIDSAWVDRKKVNAQTAQDEASVEHHRVAHMPNTELGDLATLCSAEMLVLHHFVPGGAPGERRWAEGVNFDGTVVAGEDLMTIEITNGAAYIVRAAPR